MKRVSSGPCLCAVFVDYDNIYLSLKRKSDEAAKRFATDTQSWLKQIELGALITPTNNFANNLERRMVMSRCYGNPVPRRNGRDNSTDMHSFPFVRHNFLKAGFEIADCPPLTAQLKNSSDIRMVMDIRDFLEHDTYFDEFVILSGDADFTPVLHRLRAHARRTVIFANEYTAAPYTAICDGEIREADLMSFLLEGQVSQSGPIALPGVGQMGAASDRDLIRNKIQGEVIAAVRESEKPVPIAFLADRAQRALGHEHTVGSNWAGYGAFRTFLIDNLPGDISLSDHPPYFAYDPTRHSLPGPGIGQPSALAPPTQQAAQPQVRVPALSDVAPGPKDLQEAIARIHEACKAPSLAPPDYRLLFEIMSQEITEHGLNGGQTIVNIESRASTAGLVAKRDDIEFVLEVVGEADPWFEQGASPSLFAGRFRNFVVSRCRAAGLSLSVDELDLIDAWFAAGFAVPQQGALPPAQSLAASLTANAAAARTPGAQTPAAQQPQPSPMQGTTRAPAPAASTPSPGAAGGDQQKWWSNEQPGQSQPPQNTGAGPGYQPPTQPAASQPQTTRPTAGPTPEDMSQLPRILRTQMRG